MFNTKERNREIFILRESGMSYTNIGIKFGLSRERIRQIVKKEKARAAFYETPLSTKSFTDCIYLASEQMGKGVESPLATRTHRGLARTGILRAIDTIEGLTLDEYDDDTLLSIRNFGVASLDLAREANKLYKEGLIECGLLDKELTNEQKVNV